MFKRKAKEEKQSDCCGGHDKNSDCCKDNDKDGCCEGDDKKSDCCSGHDEDKDGCCEGNTEKDDCCCGDDSVIKIKVLGTGCTKCEKLEKNVLEAVKQMDVKAVVVKVTATKDIMAHGVMSTPALVVDGKVKSTGQVLNVKQIMKLLK